MSLETVLASLGLREDPNSLDAQLRSMRREVRRISQSLSRQAGNVADDWGDSFSDIGRQAMRQGSHLAEIAGKNAWRSAEAFRRDPLPVIAVVGTALLLARLLRK